MSYDLFFKPRTGLPPSPNQFAEHFSCRPHYTLRNRQAWYENCDTGVYFSFDLTAPGEEEIDAWASFNMNLYRPHYFALEALPEIQAFVSAFAFAVEDPQGLMTEGQFVGSLFVSGWSKGNRASYRVASRSGMGPPPLLPTQRLEAIWRWNFSRRELQQRLGDAIFVPKIVFLKGAPKPRTATIWTDAGPAVLPRTDVLLLNREETAPRRFFRRSPDLAVISWAELEPFLKTFSRDDEPLPHYRLAYQAAPAAVVKFVSSLPPASSKPEGMSPDQVLNRELFEEEGGSRP